MEDHKLIQLITQLRAAFKVTVNTEADFIATIDGWERVKDGMRGGGIGRGKTIEEAMENCYQSLRGGMLVRGSGENRKEVALIEVAK